MFRWLKRFKIDRKVLRYLDYWAIIIALIIVAFATVNIFSVNQPADKSYISYKPLKLQILNLLVGLIVMYYCIYKDYLIIGSYAAVIYWASVALLLINRLFSHKVYGQANWIALGPVNIQPAELAKVALIIMLARKIDDMEGKINNIKNFSIIAFYSAVPVALIFPDMGLTMITFFTVLGIVFISGLDLKVIFGGIAALITSIGLVWNTTLIPEYQKNRLTSFINPNSDIQNTGYQLLQSKIAIGSGGLFGKGFMHGARTGGGFVPFAATDFIFSVICEEWGLIGAAFLFTLYIILIFKFIKIARNAKDLFGTLICVGVISMFLFSIIQNVGMTIGIMAISGITLPFVSYGGSALLSNFIALGLVLNVGMRKRKINF